MRQKIPVFLLKTTDRKGGLKRLITSFGLSGFEGKKVVLKANYNSADPFPASTHPDTLEVLVRALLEAGVQKLSLVERSGMGNTRSVLDTRRVLELSERYGFEVVVLDEIDKQDWVKIEKADTHWLRGFYLPKILLEAEKVVQTCCLKTHRFGGHFTLSLKNSVGLVAKRVPGGIYNYMMELHSSPHQRLMVAEINKFYKVDLVVMDAIEAFINKGPEQGETVQPSLLLASQDRVAMDAVGVSILRNYGSTNQVMKGPIFQLDQIRRASELEIGAKLAQEIILVSLTKETNEASAKIQQTLLTQG
ncbi:DUF362 domain-containing protein [Candidatus Bathyarchaeota archaeon]|nr:DUF362 domain-containing protein [Candidatus Bathyarchaeota archaeon]